MPGPGLAHARGQHAAAIIRIPVAFVCLASMSSLIPGCCITAPCPAGSGASPSGLEACPPPRSQSPCGSGRRETGYLKPSLVSAGSVSRIACLLQDATQHWGLHPGQARSVPGRPWHGNVILAVRTGASLARRCPQDRFSRPHVTRLAFGRQLRERCRVTGVNCLPAGPGFRTFGHYGRTVPADP